MALTGDHQVASDAYYSRISRSNQVVVRQNSIIFGLLTWIILHVLYVSIAGVGIYLSSEDGEWSSWGHWIECINGLRSKSRDCNNPTPSMFGHYCKGQSQIYELCDLDYSKYYEQYVNSECTYEAGNKQVDSLDEVIKQNERSTMSEINTMRHSLDILKRKTTKLTKDYRKTSKAFGTFKKQIMVDVKDMQKKTDTFTTKSEIETVKGNMKYMENDMKTIDDMVTKMLTELTAINSTMRSDMFTFTATGISGTSQLVFPYVIENIGDGYSRSNGKFTCTVPGVYFFSFQISKMYNSLTDQVECFIYHNEEQIVGSRADLVGTNKVNDAAGYSVGVSATLHLNINDYVFIGGCTGITAVYTDNRSSFTGFLVKPDDK